MNDAGNEFSDEILNAFVDKQLGNEDMVRVATAIQDDPALKDRVDQLRQVKAWVYQAYSEVKPPPQRASDSGRGVSLAIAASVAAFALGVAVTWGWLINSGSLSFSNPEPRWSVRQEAPGVLFHVNHNDPANLAQILDEVEALLTSRDPSMRVRVVVSGGGLSLFRTGKAAYPERVGELQRVYQEQVVFAGCSMTHKAMSGKNGGEINLLPELVMVPLGVLDVFEHQRMGWAYIQI